MREESVNVPEPEVVAAPPASPEQPKNVNGTNRNKRQDPTLSRHARRPLRTRGPEILSEVEGHPDISRHASKCRICNHPDRHAIEFDFLNWRNPANLACSYNLRDLTTIYRHAHATGLFAKRRLNLRFAMERIVERVNEVPVTANAVIRAARAVARINDSGEWVDPPSHLFIHRADSEETLEAESHAANGSCSGRSNAARAGTEAFVGRGFSRDKRGCLGGRGLSPDSKARSSHSSLRARQAGQGSIPGIAARDTSFTTARPSLIFDDALLDEPSESASAAGEMPRIGGKPAPTEVILELTPEFARCREERWRGIEADRQARAANAAKTAAVTDNAPTSGDRTPENDSLVRRGSNRDINVGSSSSSSPPHAALDNKETSSDDALCGSGLQPRHNARLSGASLLPQAAPDTPATAKQSPRASGPPLGSSGSANPPSPFTPEPLRRWKKRRHF